MKPDGQGRRRLTVSLSRTLTLGLVLFLLASAGASSWIIWTGAQRNTYELLNSVVQLSVNAVTEEVNSYIGAAKQQVDFLSQAIESGEIAPDDSDRLKDFMLGSLAAAPQVAGVAFVRRDFSALRAGRQGDAIGTMEENWSDSPSIRDSMANQQPLDDPSWRAVTYVDVFGSTHIVVGDSVVRDGEFLGLLFSAVSVHSLSAFLADYDGDGPIQSFVLYKDRQLLAHSSLAEGYDAASPDKPLPLIDEIDQPLISSIWNQSIDDMSSFLDGGSIEGRVVAGEDDEYIYFYRKLQALGLPNWTVGVAVRSDDIDSPYRRLMITGAFGIVILVIAIAISLYVAKSIVRPLRGLAGASLAVSNLDLKEVRPLPESRFRELDVASRAFNTMVSGLRWFETYVPRSLVLRLMRSDGASVQSEERPVTVLFTDIVGFTAIGAKLSPAELAELLNQHFSFLVEAIEEEEGTVDKYIGDSIMAFWGAPFDQPDHAERACRAAMRIARRVAADNRERRARGREAIRLRIGLHSGPAVAGNIGAPGRVNYTLIGDTVNAAQRLEALGKEVDPEAEIVVLMGAETREALPASVAVRARGLFRLRGRSSESQVFQLLLGEKEEGHG